MANPVGRPTKYRDEYIEKVDEYLATTGKEQTELPTKEGFALFIGVDDDTLDLWANKRDEEGKLLRPKFIGALRKLMLKQKTQLINDGIYGGKEVNSTIVKLLLQNNHGMAERSKLEHTGENGDAIVVKIVDDGDRITDKKLPKTTVDI